jgi:predicted nucleotidyltransferase
VDFYKLKTNLTWLHDRTIFLARHGSHAYGTSTPTSDEDFKGVVVPPLKYFFGFLEHFEQAEFKHQVDGLDMVIYDIRKFMKLATDCNPSVIEVLFTDPSDHLVLTPIGQFLLDAREHFVSRKAHYTFSGYAHQQIKRIRNHYRWLHDPPKAPPTRAEFQLPERTVIPADQLQAAQSMIRKQIESWNVPIDELDAAAKIAVQERFTEALALIQVGYKQQIISHLKAQAAFLFSDANTWRSSGPEYETSARSQEQGYDKAINEILGMSGVNLELVAGQLLGFSDNFLELLDRERHYKAKQEEWRQYQNWIATRNPARSELERKFGFDTKHGMHLVRLVRMGEEILQGKGVIVKRPDAAELLSIRYGAWKYEYLMDWADKKLTNLETLYETSPLRKGPDRVLLNRLCYNLVERLNGSYMDVSPETGKNLLTGQ